MGGDEHFTQQQKRHWSLVAGGWETWLPWIERNFAPVTAMLTEAAGWRPPARILDVACGAGYPAFMAARIVQPGGRVVATDLSAHMIAAALRHARERHVDNIEFLEMEAEHLQFADDSFDAVTNAYGLMFSPEPVRALGEARRVLKPGGRCAVVVWGEPSESPYFTVIGRAASTFLGMATMEAGAPGPFRLAPAGMLDAMLQESGFSDIRVESCPATFECASVAEYCQIFGDIALKARLASLSQDDLSRFRAAVAEAARPFMDGDCLHLVATSLFASGRK